MVMRVTETLENKWAPCHCDAPCLQTHYAPTGWRVVTILVPPGHPIHPVDAQDGEIRQHMETIIHHARFIAGGTYAG